jgi:tellurite methyltransferase
MTRRASKNYSPNAERCRQYFDKQYSKAESFWGDQPNLMVPLISCYLHPGSRALVVGCGEGRDAIFLARLGFEVVATEISEKGLARASRAATEKGLKIQFELIDAQTPHDHLGEFDSVLMMNIIQYLEPATIPDRIEHFKSLLQPGGIFCAQLFTVEDPKFLESENSKSAEKLLTIEDPERKFSLRYFERAELASYFAGWEMIYYHEGLIWDKPHGILSDFHLHGIAQMIARKTNS